MSMFQNIVYKKRNALQRKSDVQTDHHLALNMDYSRRNCIKERDKDKERRKYSSPDNEDFVMTLRQWGKQILHNVWNLLNLVLQFIAEGSGHI